MLTQYESSAIQPRFLYWCEPDPADTVGSEQEKDRLWVVLSIPRLQRGNCVVCVPLTTSLHMGCAHLIQIPDDQITMADGRPSVSCVALTDQIRSLDKTRFRKHAGYLSERALKAIFNGLDFLFGR